MRVSDQLPYTVYELFSTPSKQRKEKLNNLFQLSINSKYVFEDLQFDPDAKTTYARYVYKEFSKKQIANALDNLCNVNVFH